MCADAPSGDACAGDSTTGTVTGMVPGEPPNGVGGVAPFVEAVGTLLVALAVASAPLPFEVLPDCGGGGRVRRRAVVMRWLRNPRGASSTHSRMECVVTMFFASPAPPPARALSRCFRCLESKHACQC